MGKGNGSGGVLFPNTRGGKNIREWLETGTFPANALSMGMTFSRPTREQAKEQAQKNSVQSFRDPATKNMLDLIFEKTRDPKLEKKLLEALEKHLESLKEQGAMQDPVTRKHEKFDDLVLYESGKTKLDLAKSTDIEYLMNTFRFKSADDAMHAFSVLYFNDARIRKMEFGAVINRWNNGGEDFYTLSKIKEGGTRTVEVEFKVDADNIAWMHTHPNGLNFTLDEKGYKNDYSAGYILDSVQYLYLLNPQGDVLKSERVTKDFIDEEVDKEAAERLKNSKYGGTLSNMKEAIMIEMREGVHPIYGYIERYDVYYTVGKIIFSVSQK